MTRPLLAHAVVAVVALVSTACGADDGPQCDNPIPGDIDIGLGDVETGYEPMPTNAEVPIVLGPQGLHMIVVSVRATDFEPAADGSPHRLTIEVDHEGVLVGGTLDALVPSRTTATTTEFLGLRAPFGIAEIRQLDGGAAQVTAAVDDGCGRRLEATRSVVLRL